MYFFDRNSSIIESTTETEAKAPEKTDTTENTDNTAQDETKKTEEGTKHGGSKKKQWNKQLLMVSLIII